MLTLAHAQDQPVPPTVLILYSNGRLVPGNIAVDRGLRETMLKSVDRPINTFSEFLDWPDFGSEEYDKAMTQFIRQKYSERPPQAVITVSDHALEFVLKKRAILFPDAPVVFVNVSHPFLNSLAPLPADVVGVPADYDFSGTIAQALRWHPLARKLVVVTGASSRDRGWETRLHNEVPLVAGRMEVEYLAGLPTTDLQKRLGELGPDSVIFTPGFFQDGAGRLVNPRDSVNLMVAAAHAPMYGPFDTFIGTGAVGGRMPSFEEMGRTAGDIVNRLFAGEQPAALRLPPSEPTSLEVDWRQVKRWGIDESKIPADTVIHFKEPTFWEANGLVLAITAAIVLIQAALIAALMIERRRRQSAELDSQKQHIELAHASRLAVAGELTASIAHEIKQPLGAIQISADAADLILQAGGDRRDDLLRIVTRIRRDNQRATDVIRRLRALLAKHEPERQRFDLDSIIGDTMTLLHAEARERHISLSFRSAPTPAYVVGDQTQIQQVLINLILNAMDTVTDTSDERRSVMISSDKRAYGVAVAVQDRGHGIPADDLPRLFDSFFSTKPRGMGLGLSIARTIIEAHGGRIWAENGAVDGAVFHFELPGMVEPRVAVAAPA